MPPKAPASNPLDEISINYEEDGLQVVRELDKALLSNAGGWVTVLFRYQEYDPKKEAYGPEKFAIRRYRKREGRYASQAKFTVNNRDQAQKLVDQLQIWLAEDPVT